VVVVYSIFKLLHQTNDFAFKDLAGLQHPAGNHENIKITAVSRCGAENETVRVRIGARNDSRFLILEGFLVMHILAVRSCFILDEYGDKHRFDSQTSVLLQVAVAADHHVSHSIPRVVDANQQEAERCNSDHKNCGLGDSLEKQCGQYEDRIDFTRQYHVPKPIYEARFVAFLAACSVDHSQAVGEPDQTAYRKRDGSGKQ